MKAPLLAVMIAVLAASPVSASTVGQNTPFVPVDDARIATLPTQQQPAWRDYLARSQAQKDLDQTALAAEMMPGAAPPAPPAEDHDGAASMPLDRDATWYASPEAHHIANVIVSFQTPAGGWGKNQSRAGAPRLPGQAYVAGNMSRFPGAADFDPSSDWQYVGTLDNDATTTEIRFLAKVAGQMPDSVAYRASALRGIAYLLAAQYPNGGWPQVWPLQGGYHDAITFNDDATVMTVDLLQAVAAGSGDFAFVPNDVRAKAAASVDQALGCILASQVTINGQLTIWGQQHDPLSLMPTSARNFEMPALSTAESAHLLIFLMKQPNPSPSMQASIRAGVRWLEYHALPDLAWQKVDGDKALVPAPGALLWARYYSLETETPLFGDRDKSVHDDVRDISFERRNGYAWYNTTAKSALDAYAKWSAKQGS